jgi:hypothetical protein
LDAHGLVVNFLSSSIKGKRLIIVSQNIPTLDAVLAGAMCDGKTLVLLDVDYLHSLVAPSLPLYLLTQDPNASKEIRIGTKITSWDIRIRLILVSTTDLSTLPHSLLSRVTLVDAHFSSLETAKTCFENTFIEFFDPDLLPRVYKMLKTDLSHRSRIKTYERDTLDILADIMTTQNANPDYGYL